MSIKPCGDQTQLSSARCGAFTYLPPSMVVRHSTREKLMRHWPPLAGALTGARGRGKRASHAPAAVVFPRIIQRSIHMHGRAQAGNLPTVVGAAAFPIGLRQEEIPTGIEGVDLKFEVVAAVARRVEEDLEIVVVKDHGIVLREGGPDVRLVQFRAHVEALVVPQHLDARAKARPRMAGARSEEHTSELQSP